MVIRITTTGIAMTKPSRKTTTSSRTGEELFLLTNMELEPIAPDMGPIVGMTGCFVHALVVSADYGDAKVRVAGAAADMSLQVVSYGTAMKYAEVSFSDSTTEKEFALMAEEATRTKQVVFSDFYVY